MRRKGEGQQRVQKESWTQELSGVGTKGASSEGFDSQESIIYQWWPAVQRCAAQCNGLSDDSQLRGCLRVFSSSDSVGLRFSWVKHRYQLNLSCDSDSVLAAVTV